MAGRKYNWGFKSWAAFVVVILFCMFWTLTHTFIVDRVTVRLCAQADEWFSPSETERMPVFLNRLALDGYVWNYYAERLGKDGQWRLRYTYFDNAPHGREVHWNSAFAWYLRGLGELYSGFSGQGLRNSIFRASIWANPILFLLLLGLFVPFWAWHFGPFSGGILALALTGDHWFNEGFLPAYPDHHGLIVFSILGLFAGFILGGAGWVRPEEDGQGILPDNIKTARNGMIFSGICGGLGLWVSAVSAAMVLASVGFAVLVVSVVMGNRQKGINNYYPELFRTWALWGSGTSLFLYLAEYFPQHMGMRLEVNHPVYSLAWLGGGLLLERLGRWTVTGHKKQPFPWKSLIIPLGLCCLLPAFVLVGGSLFYKLLDPVLVKAISINQEFKPLHVIHGSSIAKWLLDFLWLPLLCINIYILYMKKIIRKEERTVWLILLLALFILLLMKMYQNRWGQLLSPIYLLLVSLTFPSLWTAFRNRNIQRYLILCALVIFIVVNSWTTFEAVRSAWNQYHSSGPVVITEPQGFGLLRRQLAQTILNDSGKEPVVLLAGADTSSLLSPLGGFSTIATDYWENVNGYADALKIADSSSFDEALVRLKERKVTHMLLSSWEYFIEVPEPSQPLSNNFFNRLFVEKQIPQWCRLIPFAPNELTRALDQKILLLQIVPEQTLEEAQMYQAIYVLKALGDARQAESQLLDILSRNSDFFPARQELAKLYFQVNKPESAAREILLALPSMPGSQREELAMETAKHLRDAGLKELARKIMDEGLKTDIEITGQ